MGFDPPDATIVEAHGRGIRWAPVDVERSEVLYNVEGVRGGLTVRIGLVKRQLDWIAIHQDVPS